MVRKLLFWNWVKYNFKSHISQYQNKTGILNGNANVYDEDSMFAEMTFLTENDGCLYYPVLLYR